MQILTRMNNVGPEVPKLSADERKCLKYDLEVSDDAADVVQTLATVGLHVGAGLREVEPSVEQRGL